MRHYDQVPLANRIALRGQETAIASPRLSLAFVERTPLVAPLAEGRRGLFRRRAAAGDELALWALRYGVPLSGGREWKNLRTELLASAPWPRSRPSHERAFKRLRAAEALLAMGDLPAAEEETLFALSHLARAKLLDADVFPLSRPELPDQLASVGEEELAAALRRAIRGGLSRDEIRGFVELVRKT